MTIVAIIPARGGSKGVHRKNLRTVGGISLVERSILHAKISRKVERIVVTSEDEEILEHAERAGVETVVRPEELATDWANGDHVIIHALNELGIEDGITVFLQPTSPLRPLGIIDQCIYEVEIHGYDSAFSVYPGHFVWFVMTNADGRAYARPFPINQNPRLPRQLMKRTEIPFIENGSVYASKTKMLIEARNRICGRTQLVEMPREDSIDIDTEYDLWLAEQRYQYVQNEVKARQEGAVKA